ncbi:acyl carrier protein [Actinomadura sp. LOL_016]|uniref:acyl carrier protein n=1 Tax=unclassified Actinomadura TaxID=2626254 RepID=UPI003A8057D3
MTRPALTMSADELRTWLTERIAEYLEKSPDEVEAEKTFDEQGLDSMAAMNLCDDVEDRMGLVVEPTLAWDHPTIDRLAEFLRETAEAEGTR